MGKKMSYAEITLKSGAVVSFDCVSVAWEKRSNLMGQVVEATLKWELPEDGAVRRPVHINLEEIATVVFVDGSA